MIIMEFLIINIYLGFVCFFICTIVSVLILKKHIQTRMLILLIILQLFFSIALSQIIWHLWPFPFDIMFGPFSLPAAIAEISILSVVVLCQRFQGR